jgi:hypothetical protein
MVMSALKQNREIRKLQLGDISQEIKGLKKQIKEYNRRLDEVMKDYKLLHKTVFTDGGKSYTHQLENLRKDWTNTRFHCAMVLQPQYRELRRKYRCLHVVYCLYGGTQMCDIEPNCNPRKWMKDTIGYGDEISMALAYQNSYQRYIEEKMVA